MSGCLTFKKLRVGQQLVGVVKKVNDFDMVISLPNQLTGFVACDRVSEPLATAFAALTNTGSSASTGEDEGGSSPGSPLSSSFPATLTAYYRPGELVIAAIVALERGSTATGTGGKSANARRRIELSLRPDHLNAGLTKEALLTGTSLLMGTVQSREDHGYTIDFACTLNSPGSGGKEELLRGFLPDQEIGSGETPLLVGKTAAFLIRAAYDVKGRAVGRVLSVTLNPETIAKGLLSPGREQSVHRDALLPGALVHAEIKGLRNFTPSSSVVRGPRLAVSCGGHEGRIDILNLPEGMVRRRLKEIDWEELFPVGKRLQARIVHVDREEGHFLLSCLEPIVHWKTDLPASSPTEPRACPRLGHIYEACSVLRIDAGLGVLLQLGLREGRGDTAGTADPDIGDAGGMDTSTLAYVHISRLCDEHVERIEGAYKVGTKHRARLIEYDAFSGLYQASLQPSVLKETLLRVDDVYPGQVVRGQVMRMEPYGALVALTERIRALCPTAHLMEVQPSSAEVALRALHPGQRYKFRVLDCDPHTRRITLTRKRGLLDTTLPLLTDYAGAVAENWHDGYVVAIRDFGVIVRFWADVKGIITVAELADEFVSSPQEAGLFVGQVVRCRIVKCDPSKPELVLSLRRQSGPKTRPPSESGEGQIPAQARVMRRKRRKVDGTSDSGVAASHPDAGGRSVVTLDDLVGMAAV